MSHVMFLSLLDISEHHNLKKKQAFSVCCYGKTCDIGHPCKSDTCYSWPHFSRTSKCLWHYAWSLHHNWPPVCLKSWPHFPI